MSIFMQYEGVTGETTDKSHQGWMDIEEVFWGVSRRITSNTSTKHDRESANAEITNLIVTRHMDSATPKLFMESCCGTGKDVVIHLAKTGSGRGADVFMEWRLKNALISEYKVDAKSQRSTRPYEKLTISFSEIEVKYTPFDQDGKATAPIAAGFDTSTNTAR